MSQNFLGFKIFCDEQLLQISFIKLCIHTYLTFEQIISNKCFKFSTSRDLHRTPRVQKWNLFTLSRTSAYMYPRRHCPRWKWTSASSPLSIKFFRRFCATNNSSSSFIIPWIIPFWVLLIIFCICHLIFFFLSHFFNSIVLSFPTSLVSTKFMAPFFAAVLWISLLFLRVKENLCF